ncbi:MAG TPA: T9SS type A sorting domain-containing protein [Bacteroidia bacterium]|jgi:PKD repeat protein|nr:T9SS type A sorting domain-containing protein [Bacteroidia bacterium]
MKFKLTFILFFLFTGNFAFSQNQRNGYPETEHLAPQVDFSWVNDCLGDSTHFINGSIRGNFYQWYILVYNTGLGVYDTLYSSKDTNIVFKFPSAGSYLVYLKADNGHVVSVTETITIDTVTNADFNFMPCSNQFINHSTCASSFQWNFGDGGTSTLELPVHQYADTGHYVVRLIASNGIHSDTMIKTITLYATHFPSASFTHHISHDTTFFHAIDYDPGIFYHWAWGDLTFGLKRDTFHIYTDTLPYHVVTLLAKDPCLYAYHSDTVFIPKASAANTHANLNFSNSSLLVFPNPASSNTDLDLFFNASGKSNAHLSLWNALGQVIFETDYYFNAGLNEFKIGTDNLAEGVYFIFLDGDNIKSKVKFLVAHKQ